MNDNDTGLKKETITFYCSNQENKPKYVGVKFTLAGSAFKIRLPTFKQGNAEEFLHFLHQFSEAKTKLGYNSCQKLESGFEQLLQRNARYEWSTIKGTVAPNLQTIAAFNKRILAYKKYTYQILQQLKYKQLIYKEFARMTNLQFPNSWIG